MIWIALILYCAGFIIVFDVSGEVTPDWRFKLAMGVIWPLLPIVMAHEMMRK